MIRYLSIPCVFLTVCLVPAQQPIDKEHAEKMDARPSCFKEHIRPVLTKTCLRCHGGKSTEAELDIDRREGLLKGGVSGPAVVPGKSRDSLLYKLITHQREPHMPQSGKKLPDAVLKLFRRVDRPRRGL